MAVIESAVVSVTGRSRLMSLREEDRLCHADGAPPIRSACRRTQTMTGCTLMLSLPSVLLLSK
jgi:hypothetical protein